MWSLVASLAYGQGLDPAVVRGTVEAHFPGWQAGSARSLGSRLPDLPIGEAALLDLVAHEVSWTALEAASEVTLVVCRPDDPSTVAAVVEAREDHARTEGRARREWSAWGPDPSTK